MNLHLLKKTTLVLLLIPIISCKTFFAAKKVTKDGVVLPFVKNTPNECYFLDEFMPVPDNMVTGRSGAVNLRYYNYAAAKYKDWPKRRVILSFYSTDKHCWSLFEELYVVE